MKKLLIVFLGLFCLSSLSFFNDNTSALAAKNKKVKQHKVKKNVKKKTKSVIKNANEEVGKKVSLGSDENFNYYRILQDDDNVKFISEVNAKYPNKHNLPFIKDYRTGLPIKQKLNNDGTVHINYSGNSELSDNFKNAIETWNDLNVIKFKVVSSSEHANVNVHGNYSLADDFSRSDYTQGRLGDADNYVDYNSDVSLKDGTKMKYISKTNVTLYSSLLNSSSNNQDHVMIHEIGHALGFDDLSSDADRGLIMYETSALGSVLLNKLDSCEKTSLKYFYQA
ncbi:matrixin family metalloprotease [Apilactobacillus apisilvae]|uniref:Matrixin family metalloprotease n=1 Tax=Apilactobacillus apisilvae TaxID=2923364 RepID=A0ABY4PGT2_9LACO|nr:matrixin family metalloprotease [Apilactobacillus apisilvae]UQS84817.1 matrixin family metalloprotease [Apilactobacillus apisilvae]